MLLWIVHGLFGVGKPALPYEEIPQAGLYVGGEISGAEAEKDYLRQACETKNPVIGMLIHRSYIQSGNTSAVDALIAALENREHSYCRSFLCFPQTPQTQSPAYALHWSAISGREERRSSTASW